MANTRFNYNVKQEIITSIRTARAEIWRDFYLRRDIKEYQFQVRSYNLSLNNYKKEHIYPIDVNIIQKAIELLDQLSNFKSKYIDEESTQELQRDLDWIKKYFKEGNFVSTSRWLSNIQETVNTMYFEYIENIKACRA